MRGSTHTQTKTVGGVWTAIGPLGPAPSRLTPPPSYRAPPSHIYAHSPESPHTHTVPVPAKPLQKLSAPSRPRPCPPDPQSHTPCQLLHTSPTLPLPQWYNIFPSLMDWLPGPHRRLFWNYRRLKDLIYRSVRDHQASLDSSSPQDFIDYFLLKIAQVGAAWKSHLWPDLLPLPHTNKDPGLSGFEYILPTSGK